MVVYQTPVQLLNIAAYVLSPRDITHSAILETKLPNFWAGFLTAKSTSLKKSIKSNGYYFKRTMKRVAILASKMRLKRKEREETA